MRTLRFEISLPVITPAMIALSLYFGDPKTASSQQAICLAMFCSGLWVARVTASQLAATIKSSLAIFLLAVSFSQ